MCWRETFPTSSPEHILRIVYRYGRSPHFGWPHPLRSQSLTIHHMEKPKKKVRERTVTLAPVLPTQPAQRKPRSARMHGHGQKREAKKKKNKSFNRRGHAAERASDGQAKQLASSEREEKNPGKRWKRRRGGGFGEVVVQRFASVLLRCARARCVRFWPRATGGRESGRGIDRSLCWQIPGSGARRLLSRDAPRKKRRAPPTARPIAPREWPLPLPMTNPLLCLVQIIRTNFGCGFCCWLERGRWGPAGD